MTVHSLSEIGEASIFRDQFKAGGKVAVEQLGFVMKRCAPNAIVNSRSGKEHTIVVMHSGWGCLYHGLPDGERQVIDFPIEGDVFVVRNGEDGTGDALVALTDLIVFEASAKAITNGLAHAPRLGGALLTAAARHQSILAQHLTNVGRRRALVRVAHFLLELATRLEGVGEATPEGYRCPLTQYDLADALGLTPIHVNRMLRELRERRLVEFRQGAVRFLDRKRLERIADFDASYLAEKSHSL